MHDDAPVVIAGASFAGLAVARELPGRALLIDSEPIGEGQTSACGAPVRVLQSLGALSSIQEIHHDLVVHTPGREVYWPLPEPFCTFDYRACCLAALDSAAADVVRASVRGHRGGMLAVTSAGAIPGRVLVDATGWRAALTRGEPRVPQRPASQHAQEDSRPARHAVSRPARYFGLEAEVPAAFAAGLHFYFWPDIVRDGYAWVFPAGGVARAGILSYRARSSLRSQLDAFLSRLRLPSGPQHGGFLGVRLAPPVVDGIFVAGDAAGHCLPFTGEGIRSAVRAGRMCGAIIRDVLDGRVARSEAEDRYTAYVGRQRRRYRVLEWSTLAALALPAGVLGWLAAWISRPGPLAAFMRHYLAMFAPEDKSHCGRRRAAAGMKP